MRQPLEHRLHASPFIRARDSSALRTTTNPSLCPIKHRTIKSALFVAGLRYIPIAGSIELLQIPTRYSTLTVLSIHPLNNPANKDEPRRRLVLEPPPSVVNPSFFAIQTQSHIQRQHQKLTTRNHSRFQLEPHTSKDWTPSSSHTSNPPKQPHHNPRTVYSPGNGSCLAFTLVEV